MRFTRPMDEIDSEEENHISNNNGKPFSASMALSAIFRKQPTQPGIYEVEVKKTANGNQEFSLKRKDDFFSTPDKLYGRMIKDFKRSWNTFKAFYSKGNTFNLGAVGYKGMGKTEFLSLLSNEAIKDGLIVVMVVNIKASIDLIKYLDSLDNLVLVLDEYTKNFDKDLQKRSLTMFNNLSKKKRMICISDNYKDALNEFFQDRTGRLHYLLEFETIDNEVILEYCKDHNVKESLIEEILNAARKVPNFSYDFLKGLVLEHELYPDDTLEDLLYYLNLKILKPRIACKVIKVEKVLEFDHDRKPIKLQEYDYTVRFSYTKTEFVEKQHSIWININGPKYTEAELEERNKLIEEAQKKKLPYPFPNVERENINIEINDRILDKYTDNNGDEYIEFINDRDYKVTVVFEDGVASKK